MKTKTPMTKSTQRAAQEWHEMLRRVHTEYEKSQPKDYIEVRYMKGRQVMHTRKVHVDIKF